MHKDNLFNSPEQGREHLSPRTLPPKNARTDPFYSPAHSPDHDLSYSEAIFSPDEMMGNRHDIKFGNVDWEARSSDSRTGRRSHKRQLTPTKKEFGHIENITLTPPPKPPKPAYYSPPRLNLQSPPQYQGIGGGLGIQYPDEKVGIDNEKRDWEPTQPPPSHYVPYTKEFEDVELNKPRGYAASQRTLTDKHYEPPGYYGGGNGRKWPAWIWILIIFCALLFFVGIPLSIFGGVYHWNYREYRCNRGWGTWDEAASTCTY